MDLKTLRKKRGHYRGVITKVINKMCDSRDEGLLSQENFSLMLSKVKDAEASVKVLDDNILDKILETSDEDGLDELLESEQESVAGFSFTLNNSLASLKLHFDDSSKPGNISDKGNFCLKPPQLNVMTFSDNDKDKFAFKNFLASFRNGVEINVDLPDAVKLTYLKGYLSGRAAQVVSHLSITDANYEVALDLLKEEFLNIPLLIDESIAQIMAMTPSFDKDFSGLRAFISDLRAKVFEFKTFNIDFLEEDSAGCLMLSHIILQKLPSSFKRELIHRSNTTFPSINCIFRFSNEIIGTLIKTSGGSNNKKPSGNNVNTPAKQGAKDPVNKFSSKPEKESKPVFDALYAKSQATGKPKFCKFCVIKGHQSYECPKYNTLAERRSRCHSLQLCTICTSNNHTFEKCPGAAGKMKYPCHFCKERNHASSLCNQFDTSKSGAASALVAGHAAVHYSSSVMHPIINVQFTKNNTSVVLPCLLDTGSTLSFVNKDAVAGLGVDFSNIIDRQIVTLYDTKEKQEGVMVAFGVKIPDEKRNDILPVFVQEDFHLDFPCDQIDLAINNIVANGYKLSKHYPQFVNGSVRLYGLLGCDFLQFLTNFSLTTCMNGKAFQLDKGIIPFGSVDHFLDVSQVKPIQSQLFRLTGEEASSVNFVMNPVSSYFSPISAVFDNCDVEQGLENLYSLENIGIKDSKISSYDDVQIEKFNRGIEFKDGKYHVDLPWHEDVIESVPSNYEIAIAVAHKVDEKLTRLGKNKEYLQVFEKQLEEGIIEPILDLDPNHKHVWIPHRPVIRDSGLVSTKIRPVFNCSLKTKDGPSLNEAAYPGVDLMSNLLNLLLQFRTENKVLLADIRQAFLQIRLKSIKDKNRFSFFIKKDGKLVPFRYTTIVFGFVSSPFILNYIVKLHAKRYFNDLCTEALINNFYVDNLVYTNNSKDVLLSLYSIANQRMLEGGFCLRAWNTNDSSVKGDMCKDTLSPLSEEKVLGYLYDVPTDMLSLANVSLNKGANTKRSILSQVSSVFDPLGLYLPVIVRGKLLIRQMWELKLSWDEVVPKNITDTWINLSNDLEQLKTFSIPRKSVSSENVNQLAVFCDASSSCYGFSAYNVSEVSTDLVFSKTKVAPIIKKSLPCLELLSVFLAFKCLEQELESLTRAKYSNVFVAVDAQVVLSWLVSKSAKPKNVFVNNRLKEIFAIKEVIESKFKCKIKFKYVPSGENCADLITRGLSVNEFVKKIDFWNHGPSWLRGPVIEWPINNLNCLNDKSKLIVSTVEPHVSVFAAGAHDQPPIEPLIKVDKFSSFSKLINVTTLVYKFIFRLRKNNDDPVKAANSYWLKFVQKENFQQELSFLLDHKVNKNTCKDVPKLVKSLNLVLDGDGLIRAKGRISKSLFYDYNVKNPVLLPKDCFLSKLIVLKLHNKCKHLGVASTVCAVRNAGFWIPKARQFVKKVLTECFICKKYNSLCYRYPARTDLPKFRVDFVKPFEHTGIDFTSHLWVTDPVTGVSKKMYILLYTCLNIRAVYIDLLPDMSTQNFILSFMRFCNLYTVPSYVYSDNAKSFIAGGDLLENAFSSSAFSDHFDIYNIKHIKIPVYSAWVGATWERMIRTVKNCLYKTIGRTKVSYFDLLTVLSDISNAVNSRPLTYRSCESELEVITPNNFLKPNINPALMLNFDTPIWKEDVEQSSLVKSLETRERMFEDFRKIWYEDYLLSLRENQSKIFEKNWHNTIAAGDVVLVKLPNKPRPFWLLGRVKSVVLGYDGKIRSVLLLRGDGVECHHSINHLYPMEITANLPRLDQNIKDCDKQSEDALSDTSSVSSSCAKTVRPKRAAAKTQRDKMSQWVQSGTV